MKYDTLLDPDPHAFEADPDPDPQKNADPCGSRIRILNAGQELGEWNEKRWVKEA